MSSSTKVGFRRNGRPETPWTAPMSYSSGGRCWCNRNFPKISPLSLLAYGHKIAKQTSAACSPRKTSGGGNAVGEPRPRPRRSLGHTVGRAARRSGLMALCGVPVFQRLMPRALRDVIAATIYYGSPFTQVCERRPSLQSNKCQSHSRNWRCPVTPLPYLLTD